MKVRLDEDTAELMQWLAQTSGLVLDALADRLLSSHLAELYELKTFIEAYPDDPSVQTQAVNLLTSYGGGEDVMAGIRRIKPGYITSEARFIRSLAGPLRKLEKAL